MSNYVVLNEFQDYARSEVLGTDDVILQSCLDAAEQMINEFCARSFTVASETATTRLYTPGNWGCPTVRIHDAVAVTAVLEDGSALAAADYQVEPWQVAWSGEAQPIEQLRRTNSVWYWEHDRPTISVTARWGWAATPPAVTQATLIIAKDVFQQRNTTAGVAGFGEFGAIRVRMNPIAMALLQPLRRAEAWGIA